MLHPPGDLTGAESEATAIPELSVVMPARDEEEVLPSVLGEALESLARIAARWELVVVDDGSRDRTGETLALWSRRDERIRVLTQPERLGYGAALRRGFAASQYMVILATDADGQYDLAEAATLYPLLREAELVAGYRTERSEGRARRAGSRLYNCVQRRLVGAEVRDVNCAFKLLRRSFVELVTLKSNGFAIDAELVVRARAAGLRTVEAPVTHRPRRAGASKVSYGAAWSTLGELWRLRRAL